MPGHVLLTPTATATDPPPDLSPTLHNKMMVGKDPKTNSLSKF